SFRPSTNVGMRLMAAYVVTVTHGTEVIPKRLTAQAFPAKQVMANKLATMTWYRMILAALKNVAMAMPTASTTVQTAKPARRGPLIASGRCTQNAMIWLKPKLRTSTAATETANARKIERRNVRNIQS